MGCAEECPVENDGSDRPRLVMPLHEGCEPFLPVPFELFRRKGRVESDIGKQGNGGIELRKGGMHDDARRVLSGKGRNISSEEIDSIGELKGASRPSTLLHHRCHHAAQAALTGWVV